MPKTIWVFLINVRLLPRLFTYKYSEYEALRFNLYKPSIKIPIPTTLDSKNRLIVSLPRLTVKPDLSNNKIKIRFCLKDDHIKSHPNLKQNQNLI